jgi:2-polyprenyl-3-methyl-5-hydroxy-6-metoxy-1,4-benzoquinol methylase
MDDPGLDKERHILALRGLARLNFWSGSIRILWPAFRELGRANPGRPLRVLDIASGAGDVPIGLCRKANQQGMPLQIDAWDISSCAVQFARSRAAQQGAAVRFLQEDALQTPIPTDYDVIISSLFLHHLDEDQAAALMQRMADVAKRMILISDLLRSRSGFYLAYWATRLLSDSQVVRTDGPLSVEGAFTREEILDLAAKAGLIGARVTQRWPFRFLLRWTRSP